MNQKSKRLFKYLIILFPFCLSLFGLFRTGTLDLTYVDTMYTNLVENSIFKDLYTFMGNYIPDTTITTIILGVFITYTYYVLMSLFFEVLLFLPSVARKLINKIGKVGD